MFEKNSVSREILGVIICIINTIIISLILKYILLKFIILDEIYRILLVILVIISIFPIVLLIMNYCAIDLDELQNEFNKLSTDIYGVLNYKLNECYELYYIPNSYMLLIIRGTIYNPSNPDYKIKRIFFKNLNEVKKWFKVKRQIDLY